ncbi:MAG TPA: hypothetical protein VN711_00825, partial [Candidatus Saccharimonadales bacterium]|nr:hypothetical protein [Candidatus Saccharimonadales bacterium]
DRRKEDVSAYKKINVPTFHLGYVEALWRKKRKGSLFKFLDNILPEVNCMYPTYRFHIINGHIAYRDEEIIEKIAKKLVKIIGLNNNSIVFTSAGVGQHVDHLITKYSVKKIYKPIYWVDQPYTKRNEASESKKFSVLMGNKQEKIALCSAYKTQLQPLFGTNNNNIYLEEDFVFSGN